jgi:hypothetical protein
MRAIADMIREQRLQAPTALPGVRSITASFDHGWQERISIMDFMLVNDEPSPQAATCSSCARRLSSGYVRHMSTRERYCDYACYRGHHLAKALMPWPLFQPCSLPGANGLTAPGASEVEMIITSSAIVHWRLATQMWTLTQSLTRALLSVGVGHL